jgi:hypothetical protein
MQTLESSSAEDGVLFASLCTLKQVAMIKPSIGVQVEGQLECPFIEKFIEFIEKYFNRIFRKKGL